MKFIKTFCLLLSLVSLTLSAQKTKKEEPKPTDKNPLHSASTFSAFKFRNIGPAMISGRIIDIAVNPKNKSEYYLGVACGGVWKTTNNGTNFQPIFDGQGSYSIGCLTLDPTNPNIVWIGSGENNNQRSVAYGDGLYKSEDAGKTWKNVGLQKSEHIGKIAIDPNDGNIVYVAAYGPLWSAGGDRGIYKTTDGGKTWKQILNVSENTGFNEIHIDPSNRNILYACAHQRRRHEWTYISGGPESAVYKSTDGGNTWNKLGGGLPSGDVGRIALAVSPINTDFVFAIVEGDEDGKGFYRSTDRGASWEKRSSWATAGNYYQEIFCDPKNIDRIYSMDTWLKVTNDGGKTFVGLGEKNKHVDNHVIYVDPDNANHYLVGCDGGLYESYDMAKTWQYKANIPIVQFYRVATDNATPFYNVYGGTQDNNSCGGPSRTISASGIVNSDWFITVGGDGFKSVIDPKDPNIVYSEWQYGGLIRYDRKTGEAFDIKPQEKEGEAAYRWNWDAPLIISNFSNTRVYFCANKVFRSEDRGNTWKTLSGDLSAGIDRNKLPVMGKVWSMDAIAKNQSTTLYGNITAFNESPKNENLLFAGTDDGLIHITTDGGNTWTKISAFANVPANTKCQNITPSQFDENIVYATFNNQRNGDFKPYLLKSIDKGKTWVNISNNLPEKGTTYAITEDYKNSNLLFCGTEFGIFVSLDGGVYWVQMKTGLPTICVPDIAIQKRENDLAIATFGRGFYILDDYSPLQNMKKEDFDKPATIFPIKDGLVFIPSQPLGHKGKSFQGESFYTAENPAMGATISYYLKNDYKTIKEKRKESEKEKIKNNQPVYYPNLDSMHLEDKEEPAYVMVQISDEQGNVIRKLKQGAKKGMYRVTWDGRIARTTPVSFYVPDADNPYESEDVGPLVIPGKYSALLMLVKNDGSTEKLTEPVTFNINSLNNASIPVADRQALHVFYLKLAELRKVVLGTSSYRSDMRNRIKFIRAALQQAQGNNLNLLVELKQIEKKLDEIDLVMDGDNSLTKREFETIPGLVGQIENIIGGLYGTTVSPSKTYEDVYQKVKKQFGSVYNNVKNTDETLRNLEKKLDNNGLPYTPGRLPVYNGN
ncbi:MAG TPA: glycosyl hydrolase [Bacteroidia bacterium]|jgi:photosystem II stability/assembly factor-like uncharacterized protein|nr:glycosyl hydrolase [Bacteroidia bacterium]